MDRDWVALEFGGVQVTPDVAREEDLLSLGTTVEEPGAAPSSGSNHLNAEHFQMDGLTPSGR